MKKEWRTFLREKYLPHRWCAGCGNGIILNVFVHAFSEAGLNQDKTVILSGIGCSGRITQYLNFDTIHTLHGRAIPLATGIKLFRPDLNVIVFTGDGDCMAIGGNHLIHAARRNIDLTVIFINNQIYGMTGGQLSPTTPLHSKTKTSPYGNKETPFNVTELVISAGATFVAKFTTYHARELKRGLVKAFFHKGFSFVEVISACPTRWGLKPVEALESQKKEKVGIIKPSPSNTD